MAEGLSHQLTEGDSWLLWDTDPAAFLIGLLACWQAGVKPVLPANGQAGSLNAVAAKGIICSQPLDCVHPALNPFGFMGQQLCYPKLGELLLFTSGSTGEPKGIIKKPGQLLAELCTLEDTFGPVTGNVISTVSHQHIYGLLFRVLWPLLSGGVIHRPAITYPEQLPTLIEQLNSPFWLVTSPAHLERLPEPDIMSQIRGKLGGLFSSGGLLSERAASAAKRCFGLAPTEVFGSTETGGVAWRRQDRTDKWQPFAGVSCTRNSDEALVVDSEVSAGTVVMGDKVVLDEAGLFTLNGRCDRIVKVEQKRLSLNAMDKALMATEWVVDGRCLLLTSAVRQQLGAVLVLNDSGRAALQNLGKYAFTQQLRRRLLNEFEPVVLPRRWRLVDTLPVNAQGKVTEQALAALFEE
ncbi:AMP-binding protein [Gallaecimonas sp. GXIMD1310]|uniref:AMP-binding protein n=1 Tax=Gallaecimonas sp. GXIMD1310 TaxID=3131926 RepID=UPI0032527656